MTLLNHTTAMLINLGLGICLIFATSDIEDKLAEIKKFNKQLPKDCDNIRNYNRVLSICAGGFLAGPLIYFGLCKSHEQATSHTWLHWCAIFFICGVIILVCASIILSSNKPNTSCTLKSGKYPLGKWPLGLVIGSCVVVAISGTQ